MAPERFQGISDGRDDIYALGATLYEFLALRPIFEANDPARLLGQIEHDLPTPLREIDRQIHPDLAAIVAKTLAKNPADRFETPAELRDELRRFNEGRPVKTRPVPAYSRVLRWCKREPWLAGANIAAAVMTMVLAIVSTIAAWTYREQRNDLQFEQLRTKTSLSRAEHAEREVHIELDRTTEAERQARLALGQSLISEGAALQRTGLIGQRFESLDRLRQAAQILRTDPDGRKRLPEIRNQAIAALGLTDLHVRLQHDCGPSVFPNFSCDAAMVRYAVVERTGAVVVRRLDDNRELVRLPGPDRREYWHAGPAFSPDGELLIAAYVRARGYLFRVWHSGRRELVAGLLSPRWYLVFHPDSRRALYCAPEGGIAIWDRDERRVVRRLPLDFEPCCLALDPEGRRIAVNNADRTAPRVVILELETGRVLADWRAQVGNTNMAWSSDGQLLAVGSYGPEDCRVYVWNVPHGALASVLQGHNSDIIGVQFAHAGYLLATTSHDGTTRLWDAASGEPLAVAPGNSLGFPADDHLLAFRMGDSGKFGIWDVAVGAECRTLHPGMLGNRSERRDAILVRSADVSPDGRLVATGHRDGVRLWEAEMGRELAHLQAGRNCEIVLFDPDEKSLITAGVWGLYRWPMRRDLEVGTDCLRVGPPELVREATPDTEHWNCATWLPDRRTLALVDNPNAGVLLIDSSHAHPARSRATVLDTGDRSGPIAVSPDGRWLAVGGWKMAGVRVWDLRRRRLERILRPQDAVGDISPSIGFSTDGRLLVSCTHSDAGASDHFWRVGTWDMVRRVHHERNGLAHYHPAFTGDGRLMALGIAPDQVLLAEADTGRELARLTTLQPVTPTPLVFSPDGTKLIARTNQRTLLVWDLRRIREQLAPMGLDWDAPSYSAASEVSGTVPPPRPVRVVGEVIEPQARRAGELAEMNRRLAANPDDDEALIDRGWLFHQQKKWAEAIVDLERRLRLRPDDADACWLLAEAYQETGSPACALAAFGRLLERVSEDGVSRFQRGLLALALDQPDLAAGDFTHILAADPDQERARYRRAQALIRLGRHREALADLDILIPKAPRDHALYQLRGTVREALGDSEQARGNLEKANSLLPKDPMPLNNRAWILATGPFDQRDPEQAVALARRAVTLASGQQLSLNTLGVALYRAGQFAEAVSVLEQSLAAGKGELDAFDLFFLAMAHHRLCHTTQARACLDRAVRWWSERKNLPAQYISELTSFRAEAEAVLALAGPGAALPADVFAPE
jgi:WD40 repeat protein/tetratricopeptide (TPR) repeat protein